MALKAESRGRRAGVKKGYRLYNVYDTNDPNRWEWVQAKNAKGAIRFIKSHGFKRRARSNPSGSGLLIGALVLTAAAVGGYFWWKSTQPATPALPPVSG